MLHQSDVDPDISLFLHIHQNLIIHFDLVFNDYSYGRLISWAWETHAYFFFGMLYVRGVY